MEWNWTRKQDKAVEQLWVRSKQFDTPSHLTLEQFKSMVKEDHLNGCLMVQWGGMFMGIETDGYTHS